jgi:endogenous inhibitor of DNA gyrase (YacG/DUF329 family)
MKHRCPICRRPTDSESDADFPFCSERCRLADLGNWASERYVVSEPVFEEDDLENLLLDDRPREEDTTPDEAGSDERDTHRRKHDSDR